MNDDASLQSVRQRIDEIDRQLQALISERGRCAEEVARIKRAKQDTAAFYRPEREAEILRTLQSRNQGPFSDEQLLRLFREIMSACLALEHTLRVAYLGPAGTFTQAAAVKHFGHAVDCVPLSAIDDVFREVASGNVEFGVVPVENSTEGVVTHTLDMFMHSSLRICGEVQLRIHHHVLSKDASLSHVRKVVAHQQSLAQCREWLDEHLPGVERMAVSSNAEAARLCAQDSGAAAIAGETAAELYELNILASNIEDEPDNTTRFLVIGDQEVPPSGQDKTSLLVSADNRAGALHRLLAPFNEHQVSLTRIESRPSRRGLWEYVFFIDVLGHACDAAVAQALDRLAGEASMMKVLGSYPQAVL